MRKAIITAIAGLLLASASTALAQTDASNCKGLDQKTCQATPGCAFYMTGAEARAQAAVKRLYMNDAERRARPPWLDYPVPENQIRWKGEEVGCLRR